LTSPRAAADRGASSARDAHAHIVAGRRSLATAAAAAPRIARVVRLFPPFERP